MSTVIAKYRFSGQVTQPPGARKAKFYITDAADGREHPVWLTRAEIVGLIKSRPPTQALDTDLLHALELLNGDRPPLHGPAPTASIMRVTLTLGGYLFHFQSFGEWVGTADRQYASCSVPKNRTIAVDKRGRVCLFDKHYRRALDEDAFPVTVYRMDV